MRIVQFDERVTLPQFTPPAALRYQVKGRAIAAHITAASTPQPSQSVKDALFIEARLLLRVCHKMVTLQACGHTEWSLGKSCSGPSGLLL